jgi:hypothetical protein
MVLVSLVYSPATVVERRKVKTKGWTQFKEGSGFSRDVSDVTVVKG